MRKRGEFGIGTLTIFIAMIVVGAIAAGVLLQTSNSLQQQALATGEQSEKELVTMLRIAEISGVDGSDGAVENLSITVKLAGGSNPVKFEDALVQLDTDTFTAYFTAQPPLNSTAYCVINNATQAADQCMMAAQNGGAGSYTYEYLNRGRNPYEGAVTDGDMARIHIAPNTSIRGGEYYRISVMPSHGTMDLAESNAPDVIQERYVAIYP